MLVTFKTKSYPNIIMFGDVARDLLKMMGHSGTIPGALLASDIAVALEKLRAGVQASGDESLGKTDNGQSDDDESQSVSLANRALPLIELLESARKGHNDVLWDS